MMRNDECSYSLYRAESNRYSFVSSSETFQNPSRGFDSSTLDSGAQSAPRSRYNENNQVLMLPTPLSVARPSPSTTSTGYTRSSEDGYTPALGSSSNQRLIPNTPTQYGYDDPYEPQPAPATHYSPAASYEGHSPRAQSPRSPAAAAGYNTAIRSVPTHQYPAETYNQYQRSQPYSSTYDERPRQSFEAEDRGAGGQRSRGAASPTDSASGQEAVRRVPRSRRPASQTPQPAQSTQPPPPPPKQHSRTTSPPPPPQKRQSRTTSPASHPASAASPPPFSLPPGAAAPQQYRTNLPPVVSASKAAYSGRYRDS